VPEGDNLARISDVLRRSLVDQTVSGARGRAAVQFGRLVGSRVNSVEARGKHLLIGFDNGLTLHTHLGLYGSWHRYRPGERWRRSPSRAGAVVETASAVAVCFDPMTVELMETRALAIHPTLSRLGPDASTADFDVDEALHRLDAPDRAAMAIGDALLDQKVFAGVGNVIRSEICFIERADPFQPVGDVDQPTRRRLVERSAAILRANRGGGARVTTGPDTAGRLYVYRRTGRPCRRCGTAIASQISAGGRRVYWCPNCQRNTTRIREPAAQG
jgi:endonuclease VIII